MNRFELNLVLSLNKFFDAHNIRAFAHRLKQSRFAEQLCDILVDSKDPRFYLAIENKSLQKGTTVLYFKQHFSITKEGHQIERMSKYVDLSGRTGFLAVELRGKRGTVPEAYLIPWNDVELKFNGNEKGFRVEDIKKYPEMPRRSSLYLLHEVFPDA